MDLPHASELKSCMVVDSHAVREYLTSQRVTIASAIRQASENHESSTTLDLTNTFPKIGSVKTSDVQLICLKHMVEELENHGYSVSVFIVRDSPRVNLEISWQSNGQKEAQEALEFVRPRLRTRP